MPEHKETLNFRFYDFYDENDQNLLYIEEENPSSITLKFEIENKSGVELVLEPYNKDPENTESESESIVSANNFHIELRFRPGVLSSASLVQIDLADASKKEWLMSRPVYNDNKEISLYFLKRDSPLKLPDKTASRPDKETASLVLRGFGANSAGGSRYTNVSINYKKFKQIDDPATISGTTNLNLTILPHRGLRKAPLAICFANHKSILNNGELSDDIELQITNISGKAIALSDKTEFTIEIDAQADGRNEPWAVAKKDHAKEFKIAIKKFKEPDDKSKKPDDKSWEWHGEDHYNKNIEDPQLTLKNIYKQVSGTGEEDRSFASNDDLILVLSNVRSSLDSGRGQIRFFYKNIPGYADDHVVLNLNKTYLIERNFL